MKANTYTIKTNPAKYDNLHKCDQKYWKFSCDFSKAQDSETLNKALTDTIDLLGRIVKSKDFKPENIAAAAELLALMDETLKAMPSDNAVATFIAYQFQRYAFRIWYRDTKAARDAATPKKAAQPKAEKKPAAKKPAQPKAEKKAPAKKAPAKQDIAKANEATFVSKLTKAQKKELVIALMAELLK